MPEYAKPIPVPDADSRPFWEACRAHRLQAQRCSACGRFRWPPRGLCPDCYSWSFDWVGLSGRGTISSYVVVHQATMLAFAEDVPYTIAHVTMDDADSRVLMTSNIVDCPWEHVRVGMPVEVVFEDVTPDVALPKFRPT